MLFVYLFWVLTIISIIIFKLHKEMCRCKGTLYSFPRNVLILLLKYPTELVKKKLPTNVKCKPVKSTFFQLRN